MSQEDMNEILAGLPVQLPGQPGPDLEGGPRFPPLTHEEMNQVFASIPQQTIVSEDELNRIFNGLLQQSGASGTESQTTENLPQY